jgi:hypothetical protein
MNKKINEQIAAITTAANGVMSEGEISDILEAVKMVQEGGGLGSVKVIIDPKGGIDIDVHVGKGKKRAAISNNLASWPRFLLTPA